ncbi:ATP synthase subunit I [Oceanidesulfovibrio marinus]|uniref:ATP synthase subunit I n=1 Tax=Oceanidesulfovibrio marinus TaxID=370038 RepID=A0A6P1ZD55_9BACT|nr:ATP synthase subunit I [Oceanidesulfovibrio marinus]QJT10777.1 ATP synthase subunit I [Oceanidesulfovibrio marinus]TVM31920.1 ATP synthase subunit I [Oceanidesulfovibrio marinus]
MTTYLGGYEGLPAPLALAAGIVVGIVFFGGLWWTVKQLPGAKNPVLLMLSSALGRFFVALAGFLAATAGKPLTSILWVAGFIGSRLVISRTLGQRGETTEEHI